MTTNVIQNDMYGAMKSGDKETKNVLSSLLASIKKAGIDGGCRDEIPETVVDAIILKEKKTLQEMIDTCPADRTETLAEYKNRMTIIEKYAPQLIVEPAEIEKFILATNIPLDKKNRGLIMKQLKNKVDMKIANSVLEKMFN